MGNDELLTSLRMALSQECRLVVQLIAGLMEVEQRRLHLESACSSMFEFCVRKLGMSEGEAFRRLCVARLAKRFPALLVAIRERRLHLSSIVLLRELFTESNVDALIAEASGKSKRAVQDLLAKYAPRPDVAPAIRKMPQRHRTSPPSTQAGESGSLAASLPAIASVAGAAVAPAAAAADAQAARSPTTFASTMIPPGRVSAIAVSAQLVPLSEERHKVQFTASTALRQKLERAQALLRHSNTTGDLAGVVERALDLLIAKLEREKLGITAKPRAPSSASSSKKGVSRAARRDAAQRDDGRCSFVSSSGERCGSVDFLEVDHRHPRALGGSNSSENLRLLCRAHNRYAAEQVFGATIVANKIEARRRRGRERRMSEHEVNGMPASVAPS